MTAHMSGPVIYPTDHQPPASPPSPYTHALYLQEVSTSTPDSLFGLHAKALVGRRISTFVDVFMVGHALLQP